MAKKRKTDIFLYTLCLEGATTAICAFERQALERDIDSAIRNAFFETWSFGGGDIKQLIDRTITARPSTPKEEEEWFAHVIVFGKPYLVLGGGAAPMGAA
jgi:hypothetical protein